MSIIILNYIIGSIPFGFLLVKYFQNTDIRMIGSHNIGATNVLRTGSKKLAFTTFLLDALKGSCAVYISSKFLDLNTAYFNISVIAVVIGHMFPLWLKFKGGKGISTNFGILLFLSPEIFLISILTWISVFKVMKISSISGLSAMTISSLVIGLQFFPKYYHLFIPYFIITVLIIFKHKDNILRIIKGNEKSFK